MKKWITFVRWKRDLCFFYHLEKKPLHVNGSTRKDQELNGTIERFKARLVARGCKQKVSVDFGETFALVAIMEHY